MIDTLSNPRKKLLAMAGALLLMPFAAAAESTLTLADPDATAGSGAPPRAATTPRVGVIAALDIPTGNHLGLGFRGAGEAMFGMAELAPQLRLDVGGRLGIIYNSAKDLPPGASASLLTIEAVPMARLVYAATPQLDLYGQGGLGLAFAHASFDSGFFSTTDNSLVLVVHLGFGAMYPLTPTLNVLGEIGFNFYTGDVGTTHIAVPTVGLQWKL